MGKKQINKHISILKRLANKRGGKLPTAKWLNENGYFRSYDVVRHAGLLSRFQRAYAR